VTPRSSRAARRRSRAPSRGGASRHPARARLHERGDLVDEGHLVEEPRVDLRRLEGLLDRRALAHRLLQHDDAAVGRVFAISSSSSFERGSPQWKLDPRFSSERSAFCSAVV
jgi:hypothetical protein